jgi:hypothetical protein
MPGTAWSAAITVRRWPARRRSGRATEAKQVRMLQTWLSTVRSGPGAPFSMALIRLASRGCGRTDFGRDVLRVECGPQFGGTLVEREAVVDGGTLDGFQA